MNLPACYLADLPADAELTPELVSQACLALARNREQHLKARSTHSVIREVAAAAASWLEPASPFLASALSAMITPTGMSSATLRDGLHAMFSTLTEESLWRWVEQDLGHRQRLDEFCATGVEQVTGRRALARGPELLAHFTAGTLPAAAVASMVAGLLVRSAQFIKCPRGASVVPRLFAHSLRQLDPGLASCLEIAEWPRDRQDLEQALLQFADGVTATGSDEAVAALRNRVPVDTLFVGHGHKLSFSYVCRESLSAGQLPPTLLGVTADVIAWNQLGCLSPHVVYVERGGHRTGEEFAADLAGRLEAEESTHPRGLIHATEAGTIRSRRSFYEVRATQATDTRLWASQDSTAWTVVFEDNPRFQLSCLNRFVYVKPVADLEDALRAADPVRRHVSTVGLAAPPARQHELALRLAEWGVTRVCPVGRMQAPPLLWRHDGRPALGELVRWADWES
jgi:hypothetical protein